jgi:hypothetical protein
MMLKYQNISMWCPHICQNIIVGDNAHVTISHLEHTYTMVVEVREAATPHSYSSHYRRARRFYCVFVLPHLHQKHAVIRHTLFDSLDKDATPVNAYSIIDVPGVSLSLWPLFCTRNRVIACTLLFDSINTLPQLPSLQYYRRSSRFLLSIFCHPIFCTRNSM